MLPIFLEKDFDHFTSQKFRLFDLHKRWQFDLQGSLASDFYTRANSCIFSRFLLRTGGNSADFFAFPLYKQGEMLPVFLEKGFDHFNS